MLSEKQDFSELFPAYKKLFSDAAIGIFFDVDLLERFIQDPAKFATLGTSGHETYRRAIVSLL